MATTFTSYFRIFHVHARSRYDTESYLFLPKSYRYLVTMRGPGVLIEPIEPAFALHLAALNSYPKEQGRLLAERYLGYSPDPGTTLLYDVPCELRQCVLEQILDRNGRPSRVLERAPRPTTLQGIGAAWFAADRMLRAELAEQVRAVVQGDLGADEDALLTAMRRYHDLHGRRASITARVRDALREFIDVVVTDCNHLELDCNTHTVGGGRHSRETVCDECFSENFEWCEDDGRHHHRDNLYCWESDELYHLDPEPEDEEDPDEDYSSSGDPNERLDYHANVMEFLSVDRSFVSSSNGDFHMGIELETVTRSHADYHGIRDLVRQTRAILDDDYVVGKYDGSLGDQGIEFVTRPTSLKQHLHKWSAWCGSPVSKKLKAWDAGCCGLHVHIDSRAFTKGALGKFLQFFNRRDNAEFIRGVAGRHPMYDSQAESYAGWDVPSDTAEMYSPLPTLRAKAGNASRYRMVNCTNLSSQESMRLGLEGSNDRLRRSANTIEVRVFRASLRKDRLLAQLEFTHALVVFCRTASFRHLTGSDFLRWLRQHGAGYRNLCRWFGITVVNPRPNHQSPESTDETGDDSPATIGVGYPDTVA